jgi:16S rRNA (cytidine1402-2'-O)-methyltransferase
MGTLYLVATPIGNLEDISLRALRVLKEAVLIAAEDTRQTQKLLQRFEISTPSISYHEHNKISRVDEILNALAGGDVALVSDAGMPGLNDPGYELVAAALRSGSTVSVVPGASAPVSALVISGLPTDAFTYLGYLPRRAADRRRRLQEVVSLPYTLIFLETPHRLREALQDLLDVLGDRPAAVARELTKLYEEVYRGSLSQALAYFTDHEPRGEFTLVIGGQIAQAAGPWSDEQLEEALLAGLEQGQPSSLLASEVAARAGWPRRDVYRLIQDLKNQRDEGNHL